MKKTLSILACVVSLALAASAADKVTIKGEGMCAKCSLKETKSCQNVIKVKDGDKTTVYYLDGDASKAFHENLCQKTAKCTATGTVKEVDGKKVLTVSKIDLDK
ncbi:MAG TPA: DUF6370 family protein [Terriglobales bacterium]|nr:DUF6370 family protein [Terriglobales bacterium]